ncbi:MAG TPA: molecular chaperone TorD family protein [Thermodesulfobacteriota bacterium]|nr:molecular chaperone TorD family protein [Thermodesulfobacteriota bacterium]
MEIYSLFGHILEPPEPSLSDQVNECISLLAPFRREAADLMNRFKTFVEETPFSRIKQIYDETFSLEGVCYPYVGYHLLGDGSHRRLFLDGLKEQYQMCNFSAVRELPDHLGVMLQFLAKNEDEDEIDELISLCIVPSLRRMLEGFEERGTAYQSLLRALLLVLLDGQGARDDQTPVEIGAQEFLRSR